MTDPHPIRVERDLAGHSQEDLAQLLGVVTKQSICLWENGKTKPSEKSLKRLREVYPNLGSDESRTRWEEADLQPKTGPDREGVHFYLSPEEAARLDQLAEEAGVKRCTMAGMIVRERIGGC